jgi:glycolate dehydrogenase FAD-binding subunit
MPEMPPQGTCGGDRHGLRTMTMQPVWLASLETLIGSDRLETHATRVQAYAVDGLVPSVVVWPETVEHVAAVLQWAQSEKLVVLPRGNGTKIRQGGLLQRLDLVLSTSHLTQLSEYDVANMTITAGAGMMCSQVSRLTAAHMQMLPLQYPFSTATLGGLIATNAYTPKRLLYGGVRDLLLGLRIALPTGEIAHFGGKVVKNVAGYDMCKLFLGSLGALGVIVEATFKLYALPERDETLLAAFPSLGQGATAVAQLMGTQLRPAQILLLNASAARAIAPPGALQVAAEEGLLVVTCEGMAEAVERQLVDITRICQGHGASTVLTLAGDAQLQLQQGLEDAMQYRDGKTRSPAPQPSPLEAEGVGGGGLVVRLGTLPSRVYTVMAAVAQVLHPLVPGAMIIGDCGVGLVKLCLGQEGLAAGRTAEPLLGALRALPGLAGANGGYAVVESAPPEAKAQIEVWGPPPASFALLKALKRKFDPEGILSSGRFIGGL